MRETRESRNGRDSLLCDHGKWMQLAQDRVQWLPLVLAVLDLCVLIPES